MIERQKQQLDEMSIKAVRNYHKSGLEIKIAVLEELDKKYNEAKRLKELIEELKNSDDYDKEQLDKLLEEYYSLVVDINKILDRNEYIDKKIYSEVIENNQLLEEQTNLKNNKSEKENEKTTISLNDSSFLEDDVNLKERIDRINNNDLVIATTGLKFAAYSKYNVAKLGPNFNLSFSKFLEKNYNNPDYQSMIRNEREREEVAKIIYNEYVNNGIELSFEEYAKQKYGINFIDIPIEDSVQKNQDEDYEDIGTGKSR